jgi:hypothetical protein
MPRNREHVAALLAFTREILEVCRGLEIEPVASGSLVVWLYTYDETLDVNDIDLSCSESDFECLAGALSGRGITVALTDWHVLQARRGELKVEFDSQEYWMRDLSQETVAAQIGELSLRVVSRDALIELYRRGAEAVGQTEGEGAAERQRSMREKLALLA